MGLWDGIEDAELFSQPKKFKVCKVCGGDGVVDGAKCAACGGFGAFRGTLEITKTIAKKTRKYGVAFIVEHIVVTTNMPAQYPVGCKASWYQDTTDVDVFFPAVLGWAAAIAGYEPHEKDDIDRDVKPALKETMDYATDNEEDNDFIGQYIRLECEEVITKKEKRKFMAHRWLPCEDQDEPEPRDAVDDTEDILF